MCLYSCPYGEHFDPKDSLCKVGSEIIVAAKPKPRQKEMDQSAWNLCLWSLKSMFNVYFFHSSTIVIKVLYFACYCQIFTCHIFMTTSISCQDQSESAAALWRPIGGRAAPATPPPGRGTTHLSEDVAARPPAPPAAGRHQRGPQLCRLHASRLPRLR